MGDIGFANTMAELDLGATAATKIALFLFQESVITKIV